MNKKWSIQEVEYLKENAGILTDNELADQLSQISGKEYTMLAIRKKRQKLGLKKVQGRGHCQLTQETLKKGFNNINGL